MGKEEIVHNEQFPLFPQCFLLDQKNISPLVNIYETISVFVAELEEPNIGMRDKGLSLLSQIFPIKMSKGCHFIT